MKKRNMVVMLVAMIPLVIKSSDERPLSVKERIALLKAAAEQDAAMKGSSRGAGKLQNPVGYVSKGGAVEVDFARRRALERLQKAADDIQRRADLNTARDVVGHVQRRRDQEPMAGLKPHVAYLMQALADLDTDEQIELLNILQTELALKAAHNVE